MTPDSAMQTRPDNYKRLFMFTVIHIMLTGSVNYKNITTVVFTVFVMYNKIITYQ